MFGVHDSCAWTRHWAPTGWLSDLRVDALFASFLSSPRIWPSGPCRPKPSPNPRPRDGRDRARTGMDGQTDKRVPIDSLDKTDYATRPWTKRYVPLLLFSAIQSWIGQIPTLDHLSGSVSFPSIPYLSYLKISNFRIHLSLPLSPCPIDRGSRSVQQCLVLRALFRSSTRLVA